MSEGASSALRELFSPASVAVVGASAHPEKWGYWLAAGALAGRSRRAVHLVNRRGGELDGVPFLRSVAELPSPVEHFVVCVPQPLVRSVVEEGLAAGGRCFTVITSGGEQSADRELAELVTAHGARLLGPNCMGVVDTEAELRLSWGDFPAGRIGLISQSGNLALEIGRLLARSGEGFSRFVSLGNQTDIDAADALEALVHHPQTKVIAAYVEDFRDGRRLARAMAAARAAGTPVLLLTVGRSEASGRAAASHTGALVSSLDTVDAACRAAGALRVDSAGELVDAALALLTDRQPAGRRVAVVGDSGGQGALAADALSARGLTVPALSTGGNPVDLAGAGEADLNNYARIARRLLDSAETDAVVLTGYFGDYATANPAQEGQECAVAKELAQASADSGRPLYVHTMARDTAALTVLREHGVPVAERIEQTAAALAHAADWALARPTGIPSAEPAAPVAEPLPDGDYRTTRALLASYGLAFPAAEFIPPDPRRAAQAAERIGYPVALKAMGLAHKTEAGGVALNLPDAATLRAALERMCSATGADTYAVEAMAAPAHGVELIAGVRRDPSFGPTLMVGIGGTTAELLADTAVALAPLDQPAARELLLTLRHAPLLTGWRGAPPVDLDAAARALVLLARAAVDHPELAEVEINPLLVHPKGALALDAHGVLNHGVLSR